MIAAPTTPPADLHGDDAPPRAHHPDPLSTLLSSTLPLSDLAASLHLSLPDFLALCQSPDFQSHLAAIDNLTQTRLRIQSSQARLTAIDALESLTKSAQDPVERRRAASSLMRATSAATQRTRAHDDTDDGSDDLSRARPRPRHLPSRRLRADQVAALIARALADNDSPAPDSGLATLHAFLSTDTRAASPHLPDLAGLSDLLDAPDAVTCSAPTQHGRTATVDLRTTSSGTESPPHTRFHLTRPDTGPHRMCWLIDRITRVGVAPSTGPPPDNH